MSSAAHASSSIAVGLAASPRNRLLAALPPDTRAALGAHLHRVTFSAGDVLYGPAKAVSHVYFPETAVVSVLTLLGRDVADATDAPAASTVTRSDGDAHYGGPAIEIGTVGWEGMVGLGAFLSGGEGGTATSALGGDAPGVRAVAQVPGEALCMAADTFAEFAGPPGPLHRLLLHYTQAYLGQVAQTAACNAAHRLEARCARWLLATHDRTASDRLPLTHTFLSAMLGVRETGVATALGALEARGLVRATRHEVAIVDRPGLERASCTCYGAVRDEYARLLGTPLRPAGVA